MVQACSPIGARFNAAESSPNHNIGARGFDNAGNVYLYTQYDTAGTGLGLGFGVVLPGTSNQAQGLTLALSSAGHSIGFCQVGSAGANSVSAGAYFWAQIEGQGSIAVLSACVGAVPLYTTSTGGVLDDTANGNIINGVVINATVTGDGTKVATGTIVGGRSVARIA